MKEEERKKNEEEKKGRRKNVRDIEEKDNEVEEKADKKRKGCRGKGRGSRREIRKNVKDIGKKWHQKIKETQGKTLEAIPLIKEMLETWSNGMKECVASHSSRLAAAYVLFSSFNIQSQRLSFLLRLQ